MNDEMQYILSDWSTHCFATPKRSHAIVLYNSLFVKSACLLSGSALLNLSNIYLLGFERSNNWHILSKLFLCSH